MTWVIFSLLTLVTILFLLSPIVRSKNNNSQDDYIRENELYKDQILEIRRDQETGLINAKESEAAKKEIERRITLSTTRRQSQASPTNHILRAFVLIGIAVLVPFSVLGIYTSIGSPKPEVTSQPLIETKSREHPNETSPTVLIKRLEERLMNEPDSAEGWILLARSYRQISRSKEAITAYRNAIDTGKANNVAKSEFGEALVESMAGTVSAEAANIFSEVLLENRSDPRARFFLGLQKAQNSDPESAISIWRELSATSPEGAPWLPMVREQIKNTALSAQIMPINIEPKHPLDNNRNVVPLKSVQGIPEPDEENFLPDVSSLSNRFSGSELSMIQEMVGGLEAKLEFEPNNFAGWMQLAKSYSVLGNIEKTKTAYRGAAAANAQAIEPRVQLADLILKSTNTNDSIPTEVARLGKEILVLDAKNPDGLFISGLIAENSSDYITAREYWTELINILGAENPAVSAVENRLTKLPQ